MRMNACWSVNYLIINSFMPGMLKFGQRRNALFYKTLNGAGVGDLFMSLIHTCELNGANPFDYLTELLRHAEEMKRSPSEWMPWNFREPLARLARPAAA
jgi:transposase